MPTSADRDTSGGALLTEPLGDTLALLAAGELHSPAGNAAAISAAFAAALAAAAARGLDASVAEGAVAQCDSLRERLCALAEHSAPAHRRALALLDRAEHATSHDDQNAGVRDHELGTALSEAADVPLAICEAAADVVALSCWIARDGPAATRADAVAAAALAEAAVASAAALVHTNLAVQPQDDRARRANACATAAAASRRALAEEERA
jgi:formiminotetrahydrofolate cyclodeaminase